MPADKIYLETLLLYYEEEVEGEAYFQTMADAFETPDHKEKLRLLAEVERHAAESVEPLLAKYGLKPRPTEELRALGHAEASATKADWSALIAGMNASYPGYLVSFEKLEAMAPPADRARLSFLTEHEHAALAFLAEEARDPTASSAPLRTYLETDPAAWVARVA